MQTLRETPSEATITCVKQPVDAGRAALSLTRVLHREETVLTLRSRRCQSNFYGHFWRAFQPEFGRCHVASKPADLDIWPHVQPESGRCRVASKLAELDIWPHAQPESGRCRVASTPADLDIWQQFQPETGRCRVASKLAEHDI